MASEEAFKPSALFNDIEQKLATFWESKRNCFVGRETVIKELVNGVLQLSSDSEKNVKTNFVVIEGAPGAGKSSVAAALPAKFTFGNGQPELKLISYAFSLSHQHINTIADFAEYVCGCLQRDFGVGDKRDPDPVNRLKTCLLEAAQSPIAEEAGRIYLLIDGLEEFRGYLKLLEQLPRSSKIMYLLFAQPNVVQVDDKNNFTIIKLADLTPEEGIQILKDRLGDDKWETAQPIAVKLLAHPENLNPLILTEFAKEFAQHPGIKDDLWEGVRGLKSYFDRRAEDLGEVERKILGALAYAYEPLSLEALDCFVGEDAPVLRNSFDVVGRFIVSYDNLKNRHNKRYEYRHNAWKTFARDFRAAGTSFALWSGENASSCKVDDLGYSLRWGARHLICAAEWDKAARLLMDFDYLMGRIMAGARDSLFQDYEEVSQHCENQIFKDWFAFIGEIVHILWRDDRDWGAERIFYQLAWEDTKREVVSAAAKKYDTEGKVTWVQMLASEANRIDSQKATKLNNCRFLAVDCGRLQISEGDPALVEWEPYKDCLNQFNKAYRSIATYARGFLELAGDKIMTWGLPTNPLRIWDVSTGTLLTEIHGPTYAVEGAIALNDGRILLWYDQGHENSPLPRIWNIGINSLVEFRDAGCLRFALKLKDNRILTSSHYDNDPGPQIWNPTLEKVSAKFKGNTESVYHAVELLDGKILSWGSYDDPICIWCANTGECLQKSNSPYKMFIDEAIRLEDGRVLFRGEMVTATTIDLRMVGRDEVFDVSKGRYLKYGERIHSGNGFALCLWDISKNSLGAVWQSKFNIFKLIAKTSFPMNVILHNNGVVTINLLTGTSNGKNHGG